MAAFSTTTTIFLHRSATHLPRHGYGGGLHHHHPSSLIPPPTLTMPLFPALPKRSCRRPPPNPLTCRSSLHALTPELKESLDKFVSSHKVVLFMKGTKMFPQCGFSNTVVQILNSMNVPFETVNILEDDAIRMGMKEYSNWPTFPQLYIDGEFFGGCDITLAAYHTGELQESLERAMCS